jgi:hypothetical protein
MTPEQASSLALVRGALGRARIAQVVLGLVVAGMGWLFTFSLDESSTLGSKIGVGVMSSFFALMAGVLFWVALFKNSPSRSPLVRALAEKPDTVVWLYQQDIDVQVNGVQAPVTNANVIVRLADGSTVAITVHKTKAASLMAALQTLAPQAVSGYSEEREALFKRDPRALAGA